MSVALRVTEITKRIGGLQILDQVSMTVSAGERRALIGPNGAGKTTLLNIIAGFLRPSRGTIELFGIDVTKLPPHRRVQHGLLKTNQLPGVFPDLSVRSNLQLALLRERHASMGFHVLPRRDGYLRDRVEQVLEVWGLQDVADREVRHLPHGYQRMMELAMRMSRQPRVLLLDEPAAGLTEAEVAVLAERLSQLPRELTVVIVEHKMRLIFAFADRITVLHHGAVIAEGTPEEIRSDPQTRAAYLGGAVRNVHADHS